MSGKAALTGALALIFCTAALAQDPNFEAQRSIPDTPGSGPYPALMEVDPALPDHVVYRPADLSRVGEGKLGVFVWGNGACADDGASARLHLSEIASHGYLVIAPGKWRNGPGAKEGPAPPRTPGPDGTLPPPPTTAADLTEALDWALADDSRPRSRSAGLIDEGGVAAGSFSCGGVQALAIDGDPRLRRVVVQNSGIFADGAPRIVGMDVTKSGLRALHTPVIYSQGGETDIAYANGR